MNHVSNINVSEKGISCATSGSLLRFPQAKSMEMSGELNCSASSEDCGMFLAQCETLYRLDNIVKPSQQAVSS